jgi:hypothetical protein
MAATEAQITEINERIVTDPQFRAAFREDPVAAVKRAGWVIDEEDHERFRSTWNGLNDEELLARVSKRGVAWGV